MSEHSPTSSSVSSSEAPTTGFPSVAEIAERLREYAGGKPVSRESDTLRIAAVMLTEQATAIRLAHRAFDRIDVPASLAGTPEQTGTPDGYRCIAPNVYVGRGEIIVRGTPSGVEDEKDPAYHNCDAMGCGWDHVLFREKLAGTASPASSDVLTGRYVVRQQGREWRLIDTAIPASPDAPVAWFINSGEAKVFADWLASLSAPVSPSASIAVPTTALQGESWDGILNGSPRWDTVEYWDAKIKQWWAKMLEHRNAGDTSEMLGCSHVIRNAEFMRGRATENEDIRRRLAQAPASIAEDTGTTDADGRCSVCGKKVVRCYFSGAGRVCIDCATRAVRLLAESSPAVDAGTTDRLREHEMDTLRSAWPPRDVVQRLLDAADHLLKDRDYDAHGYETMASAATVARDWLARSPAVDDETVKPVDTIREHIFTREMVDSWKHSNKCIDLPGERCICGLSAVQAIARREKSFVFRTLPALAARRSPESVPEATR